MSGWSAASQMTVSAIILAKHFYYSVSPCMLPHGLARYVGNGPTPAQTSQFVQLVDGGAQVLHYEQRSAHSLAAIGSVTLALPPVRQRQI